MLKSVVDEQGTCSAASQQLVAHVTTDISHSFSCLYKTTISMSLTRCYFGVTHFHNSVYDNSEKIRQLLRKHGYNN